MINIICCDISFHFFMNHIFIWANLFSLSHHRLNLFFLKHKSWFFFSCEHKQYFGIIKKKEHIHESSFPPKQTCKSKLTHTIRKGDCRWCQFLQHHVLHSIHRPRGIFCTVHASYVSTPTTPYYSSTLIFQHCPPHSLYLQSLPFHHQRLISSLHDRVLLVNVEYFGRSWLHHKLQVLLRNTPKKCEFSALQRLIMILCAFICSTLYINAFFCLKFVFIL